MKKKLKNILNLKKITLFIRPQCNIKSRQWWHKQIKRIQKPFEKHLHNNKKTIFKRCAYSILITNNKEIKQLNSKFRNKKRTTDVLSFHLDKNEQYNQRYLGDIVISAEYVQKNAKNDMVSIEKELIILLVHGCLHLLGYDHIKPKDLKLMAPLQRNILNELSIYHE